MNHVTVKNGLSYQDLSGSCVKHVAKRDNLRLVLDLKVDEKCCKTMVYTRLSPPHVQWF